MVDGSLSLRSEANPFSSGTNVESDHSNFEELALTTELRPQPVRDVGLQRIVDGRIPLAS